MKFTSFLTALGGAALSVMTLAQVPSPGGTAPQPRANQRASLRPVMADDLAKGAADDWLTYHGSYTGDHYSTLTQISTQTVARLRRAWISDIDAPVVPA